MKTIQLRTKIRNTTGNGPARSLRRSGFIPAVLYGRNTDTVNLCVATGELEKIVQKGNIGQTVLTLFLENGGKSKKTAMIKELQAHPVSGDLIHVDFYEVAMDRRITVSIPIEVQGTSRGVTEGGILQIVRHELDVECLPNAIPETIPIDVTDMGIGDAFHVEEIDLEGDVEILADTNFTVVTVVSPVMEAEAEEELEEEDEEAAADEDAEETDVEEEA